MILATHLFCYLFMLFIIFLFYHEFCRRKFSQIYGSRIPAVFGLPLLGIVPQILPTRKCLYTLDYYYNRFKQLTYISWIGTNSIIFTADPEVIKVILTSQDYLAKPKLFYGGIRKALSATPHTNPLEKWQKNRKLMNPAFHTGILNNFIPAFNKGMRIAVKQFDDLVDTGERQVFEIVRKSIFLTTLANILDIPITNDSSTDCNIVKAFEDCLQQISLNVIFSTIGLGFFVRRAKYYKSVNFLRNFIKNFIATREQTKSATPINEPSDRTFVNQVYKLFESGLFDKDDLHNEALTVVTAAYDTTATTLYSALYLLAMHPDIQEELYAAICDVMPDKTTEIEKDHLNSLPLLNMVINETLRLIPAIPLIARQALVSKQVTNDLYIPQGAIIAITTYSLHRCPNIWGSDANEFKPYRFLPENLENIHSFAYIPFSKGQRNCLGWRYADISLRVFLIGLLRHFKFSTSFPYDKLVFQEHMTVVVHKQPKLKIERRI